MRRTIILSICCAFIFCMFVELSARRMGPGRGPGAKHFVDFMDTNKDGKVSLEEWNTHHKQRFTEMDKNKDGYIDENEIREFHEKRRKGRRGR